MKKIIPSLKEFIFSARHFLITGLIVVFLFTLSLKESSNPLKKSIDSLFDSSLFDFSLTDLTLIFLAIYAIWKKPWVENLAGHFKKAYRAQLKSIQNAVSEMDELSEKYPDPNANIMGKQLWEGNKENFIKDLEEIENIKSSKDARRISSQYVLMLDISWYLREEIDKLRDLESLAKTGKIRGTVGFTNKFTEEFPEQLQFNTLIRLKPEYIRDRCISRFWLWGNPFHPYDPDTGKKVKKHHLPRDDHWWLLSMNSPYWKYVLSVTLDLDDQTHVLNDGRRISVPPTDFPLPDGSRLLDLRGETLFPMRIGRDGDTC